MQTLVHPGLHGFAAQIIAAQAVNVFTHVVDVLSHPDELAGVIRKRRLDLGKPVLNSFRTS